MKSLIIIFKIIGGKYKDIVMLTLLAFFASIAEVFSIGMIIPFMSLLADPSVITQNYPFLIDNFDILTDTLTNTLTSLTKTTMSLLDTLPKELEDVINNEKEDMEQFVKEHTFKFTAECPQDVLDFEDNGKRRY